MIDMALSKSYLIYYIEFYYWNNICSDKCITNITILILNFYQNRVYEIMSFFRAQLFYYSFQISYRYI